MIKITINNNFYFNSEDLAQVVVNNKSKFNNMAIQLEKYSGRSSRYTCPKCNRAHCLTRYINTETGQYIHTSVGICNHANSCGYKLSPKQYYDMNPDQIKYIGTRTNNNFYDRNRKKEIKPIKSIDKKHLFDSLGKGSNFHSFLGSLFTKQEVSNTIRNYFIGGCEDGRVKFWQIDAQARLRTAKLIQYDPLTGKRRKDEAVNLSADYSSVRFTPPVAWEHSDLIKKGLLDKNWQLTQCLFGEHLINKYPHKPIIIVEGEKTAIILSIYLPQFNIMATGGLMALNSQKIRPIRDSIIIAFPDFGCLEKWQLKADSINAEIGSKIMVETVFDSTAKSLGMENGVDVVDLILSDCFSSSTKKDFFDSFFKHLIEKDFIKNKTKKDFTESKKGFAKTP